MDASSKSRRRSAGRDGHGSAAATTTTTKGRAYEHIRRSILDARIPVGTALSEYQLAKEIGVSRTPVREALKRLEQDGLVRSVPRRGTFVANLTVRDIVEIYQIRIQLEGLAARVAAERMDAAGLAELIRGLDKADKAARQGRTDAAREHDRHMHKKIIESTSNGRLAQILTTLDDQVHRIRQRALSHPSRVPATLAEHRAMLDAIAKRNPSRAEKTMRDHLQAAPENAIHMALAGTVF
ncbi:MAG: GntR family transcriptional regulator [Elusimicrobia bacterium]|nr:GntR family transcriptional regulator [Elusimicrobiota bacterium]